MAAAAAEEVEEVSVSGPSPDTSTTSRRLSASSDRADMVRRSGRPSKWSADAPGPPFKA